MKISADSGLPCTTPQRMLKGKESVLLMIIIPIRLEFRIMIMVQSISKVEILESHFDIIVTKVVKSLFKISF